jgi:hypothetical protein
MEAGRSEGIVGHSDAALALSGLRVYPANRDARVWLTEIESMD